MKVESAGATGSAPHRRIRKRRWIGPIAGTAMLVAAVLFGGLSSDESQRRLIQATGAPTAELAWRSALSAPARFARSMILAERAPQLKLDIKFKHLHKIHEKRDEALAAGALHGSPDDFVPASVEADGRSSKVELRLVAADVEELLGSKWSLRIHLKGGGSAFGMQRFTLLAPAVRGFQAEPLFLQHLRREDVLAPRYLFVETVFNGNHLGLMAVEESPSAALLESQQRRDGVILRLIVPPSYVPGGERKSNRIEVRPARGKHVTSSKKLSRNLETASRRLRAFLEGDLDPGVVFDVEAMGRFLAVVECWGAFNALEWSNLRFYFNPLTANLEPIGFAGETQRDGFAERGVRDTAFGQWMLGNSDIEAAYAAALSRSHVGNRSAADPLMASEQRWLRLLHREYPMRSELEPALAEAGAERAKRSLSRLAAASPPSNAAREIESPWPMQRAIIRARSVEENLKRHAFLRWHAAANEFSVSPGYWAVDGSLLLPEGAGLRVPAGVVLRFEADAGLIARGPLIFEGTEEAPIVLEGPASGKRKKLWSGVYVVESAAPSHWSHVHIRNTGGFKRRAWQLPGGVIFRKTHVDFEHCRFTANRSDDSLNLVRSSFSMRDVSIRDAQSDALDLDYSRGSIDGGVIEVAGGDGIDLGGSELRVRGMRLSGLHDKAIVVGELSSLDAADLEIEKADIGLASKNGSRAELRDSLLRNIDRVALLAYTNRSEFGPGVLIAEGNQIESAGRIALSELDSEIIIDGRRVAGEDISIASLEDLAASDR